MASKRQNKFVWVVRLSLWIRYVLRRFQDLVDFDKDKKRDHVFVHIENTLNADLQSYDIEHILTLAYKQALAEGKDPLGCKWRIVDKRGKKVIGNDSNESFQYDFDGPNSFIFAWDQYLVERAP